MNKWHIIIVAVCLLAGIVLGLWLRGCTAKPAKPGPAKPIVIHDTILVQDSAWLAKHTKPKYVTRHDTLWLPKPEIPRDSTDSVYECRVNDSIPVDVPITQYEYRDTFETDSRRIELGIEFSGWHAQIDSIDLKSRYTIQPAVVEKKRGWGQFVGIGVGAGYGASVVGNQVFAAPQIGVSIVYGFGYHW